MASATHDVLGLYMTDGRPFPTVIQVDPEPKSEKSKKDLRNQMKKENVINTKCAVCRKKTKGIKKCNGCYITWYCGKKCQRLHWVNHKDLCLKVRSQYRVAKYSNVFVKDLQFNTANLANATLSDVRDANDNLIKKHFVVRVKLLEKEILHISNQDRSFKGLLFKEENFHTNLTTKISSGGFQGVEGYFHATLEPGDKESSQFRINPENIFIEAWSDFPEELLLI